MYKRIFVISLFAIMALIVVLNKDMYNKESKNSVNVIEEGINYFNTNVLKNSDNINNYFKDRYVTINNNVLSIGKNKNELDNGYYDIVIRVNKKNIELYVNKLFKDFDNGTICDEIYVNEIIGFIEKIFNFKVDKEEFRNLLISNYENIRDIDRNNVETVDKTALISKISIVINVENNELVLKMGDI